MFSAGISLALCFDQLEAQSDSPQTSQIAASVAARLRKGESLHQAFAARPDAFTPLQIHLIRVGTQSGSLEHIFTQLAVYEEQKRELIQRLKATFTYPILVFAIGMLGLFCLPTLVMGGLFGMLESSGQPLPLLTRVLLGWAHLLRTLWFYPLALVLLAAAYHLALAAWRQDALRLAFLNHLLSLPVLGRVIRMLVTLRFSRCLLLQIRAGVPLLTAISLSAKATAFDPARQVGKDLEEGLRGGQTLAEALAQQTLLEPMLTHMVAAGEESGKLTSLLQCAVRLYEQELTHVLEVAVSLLEPILMAVLGGIVGLFILGIALPLVQLIQTFA
ncbi:MAG: type II secretion system F family protein [Candidatus Eremiobacteraeota bacterium]|nr:type II secretion system F family protein [Candidatus Eremiobacteraeota bacterium]